VSIHHRGEGKQKGQTGAQKSRGRHSLQQRIAEHENQEKAPSEQKPGPGAPGEIGKAHQQKAARGREPDSQEAKLNQR
jgi:hypothetical protein